MAVETDLYKRVYFNDGEGLTHGDLNNIQGFLHSQFLDGMLAKLVPGLVPGVPNTNDQEVPDYEVPGTNGANVSSAYAYALHGGGAYVKGSATGGTVSITPGTLFQRVGTGDGETPTFLPFTFDGTQSVTIPDGSGAPGDWRIDLIQMKLEIIEDDSETRDFKDATTGAITSTSMDKSRRIQCTLSVKMGTPSAAPPTFPDPDAGYVPVGAAMVYESWVGATDPLNQFAANAHVMDLRMPIRVRAYEVGADKIIPGTNATRHASGGYVITSNATNSIHAICPFFGQTGRIIGVGICGGTLTTGDVELHQYSPQTAWDYGGSGTDLADVGHLNGYSYQFFPIDVIEATGKRPGYTTIASAGGIGTPIWSWGEPCIPEWHTTNGNDSRPQRVGLRFTNVDNGFLVNSITFYVAEGI